MFVAAPVVLARDHVSSGVSASARCSLRRPAGAYKHLANARRFVCGDVRLALGNRPRTGPAAVAAPVDIRMQAAPVDVQDSPRKSIRFEQHQLIKRLADTIEEVWENKLDLTPYELPEDLGIVEGRLEGERLVIENKCFQSTAFRKMHLELARVGNNLDILHCVMFPNKEYALPMFGADLVGGRGQLSACIVDLSPTSPNGLPAGYVERLEGLERPQFSQPRELPPWGHIFSPFCTFIRPAGENEEDQFLALVRSYMEIHCDMANIMPKLTAVDDINNNLRGQKSYCTSQQQNDKTRRVLEMAFGDAWAERYMTTVLFDLPEEAAHL
eukprot:tig00021357_g20747.t1